MIAVIFHEPVSIERCESLTARWRSLSLSLWRDEEAVRQWRNVEEHRHAQGAPCPSQLQNPRIRSSAEHAFEDFAAGAFVCFASATQLRSSFVVGG